MLVDRISGIDYNFQIMPINSEVWIHGIVGLVSLLSVRTARQIFVPKQIVILNLNQKDIVYAFVDFTIYENKYRYDLIN